CILMFLSAIFTASFSFSYLYLHIKIKLYIDVPESPIDLYIFFQSVFDPYQDFPVLMAHVEDTAVHVLEFRHSFRCMSDEYQILSLIYPLDIFSAVVHGLVQQLFFLSGASDSCHSCPWGIAHQRSVIHFLLVEPFIILGCCSLDTIIVRVIGLNHSLPGCSPSPGSSYCLKEQLECFLSCPVISAAQRKVRCQYAYQSYPWKIMAFYDHLCPNENVRLAISESRQNLFMIIFFSGSICVHPQDFRPGKTFPDQTFYLLCSCPESSYIRRSAYRALLHIHSLITAVMADQSAVSMGSQGHVAVGTFHYMAAGTAAHKTAVSSSVQKKDDLLLFLQSFPYFFSKKTAEY